MVLAAYLSNVRSQCRDAAVRIERWKRGQTWPSRVFNGARFETARLGNPSASLPVAASERVSAIAGFCDRLAAPPSGRSPALCEGSGSHAALSINGGKGLFGSLKARTRLTASEDCTVVVRAALTRAARICFLLRLAQGARSARRPTPQACDPGLPGLTFVRATDDGGVTAAERDLPNQSAGGVP